jgi:exopolysaccharide production protein ExoQ
MPPLLALFGSLVFIVWLFVRDAREEPVGSKALWIPSLWILIISTRPVVYWMPSSVGSSGSSIEGNWVDLSVLGLLIVSAWSALLRRRINWGEFFADNRAIILMYLFFFGSMLWSEYPFATVKRVIKDFSVVLFALMLLSESNPGYAIRKLFLRCSYVVFTLSVITIKYFPEIGTNVSNANDNMFTGLTTQKNSLGEVVFTYTMVLVWDLTIIMKTEGARWKDMRVLIRCVMLAQGLWLLITCDSQTALICLIIGLVLFWATGRLQKKPGLKPKLIALCVAPLLLFGLDSTLNLKEMILEAVGRDATFTGRTNIWELVLSQPVNPLLGTGFLMFWDGSIGQNALDELGARITTAHNGYLEMYLDGGLMGLSLFGMMLLARGNHIINQLVNRSYWGRLGFIYFILALIHNFSESTFFRFSILWFFLMLSMLKFRGRPSAGVYDQDNIQGNEGAHANG